MLLHTPFHARIAEHCTTQLWNHWAGHLVVDKFQMSEKVEYYAIRNSVGLFDTSPLFKYWIRGRDAERFLSFVLARDITTCRPGQAQYTMWCDERGYVMEDGVILRHSADEFFLTAARPVQSYFESLRGRDHVEIEDVSTQWGALAVQGPHSRTVLADLAPEVAELGYFDHTPAKIADAPVTISRTGFTGDLGYEVWVPAEHALDVWDAIWRAGHGHGMIPFGQTALLMARIEAGLLLINVDFQSSRYAENDAHRSTPMELGWGWMLRGVDDGDRRFVGRDAIRAARTEGTARWKMVALAVDHADYDTKFTGAGLKPPKNHRPLHEVSMVYDRDGERVGYATSSLYSPILQRHIALARVRPDLAVVGAPVALEFTIDHRYVKIDAEVTRSPMFNPTRKTD